MNTNVVLFGDCLDLLSDIPQNSVDMIFCDLPYGTTKCPWDSIIDLDKLWVHYERIIKDHGAILLNAQTPFSNVLGSSNLSLLRYDWIWEKSSATGHLNAKKMPMKAHESILVFYKKLPTYNPQKTSGHVRKTAFKRKSLNSPVYNDNISDTYYDSTDRYPRSVLRFPSDKQKSNLHPTQKPLALGEYFIKTYSNEGDLIVDNACGSGTYGLAAKKTNRKFILMDNDINSYNTAKQRIL